MRAVALIALLPTLALAGWTRVGTVTGAPTDIVVADAGVVLVTTSTQAVAFGVDTDGGFTAFASVTTGSSFAGAALIGDCLSAGNNNGQIAFSASCGLSPTTVTLNGVTAYRALGARGVALTAVGLTTTLSNSSDVTSMSSWSPATPTFLQSTSARGFGLARIGGIDYAVATSTGDARLSVDGGTLTTLTGVTSTVDVWPYALNASPAMLAVTALGELELVRNLDAVTIEALPLPAGVTPRRVAAFGMQGMLSSDAGVVLSPVPDSSRVSERWVARVNAPLLNDRVFCLDERWCAGVTTTGEVWLYENTAAPGVELTSTFAGGVAQLTADAGDVDGDPLLITWSAPGFTLNADGGAAELTLGGACSANVDVVVRDSLFVTTKPVQVVSDERGEFGVQGAVMAIAGGAPVSFSAAIDGGCVGGELSWSDSEGGSATGASFTFTPPATWCTPGTPVTITATASWDAGTPATTQLQRQLTIAPWGAPAAPIFASPATQDAGEQVVWSPTNAAHVCESASGFPGTEFIWSIDAGGANVSIVDGGLLIDSSGVCVATQVTASARRQVIGEQFGRVSAAGALVVDLLPDTAPLTVSTPFTLTVDAGAGIVSGAVDVGASCLSQRALTAEISVDTGTQGTFSAPGDWSLSIPGGCAGGTWNISARLLENGTFTGAQTQAMVTTEATPVAVGQLDVTALLASCGAGVTQQVQLQPVDGSCLSADVSWRAINGPPLDVAAGTGSTLALQTTARDLSVVGQNLELEFTVSSGAGNSVTETRSLPISVEPFIDVATRIDPVLAQLEDGRSYVFTLTSALPCEVSGLVVKLPLRRVDPQSVRVDGRLAQASASNDELQISPVLLGPNPVEIRVHGSGVLLGGSDPEASVWLNGVRVSREKPATTPAKKCGCSSLDGAFVGLWLMVLWLRRRNAQTK